jgi:Ca2+-binding RTX toxin-like protein
MDQIRAIRAAAAESGNWAGALSEIEDVIANMPSFLEGKKGAVLYTGDNFFRSVINTQLGEGVTSLQKANQLALQFRDQFPDFAIIDDQPVSKIVFGNSEFDGILAEALEQSGSNLSLPQYKFGVDEGAGTVDSLAGRVSANFVSSLPDGFEIEVFAGHSRGNLDVLNSDLANLEKGSFWRSELPTLLESGKNFRINGISAAVLRNIAAENGGAFSDETIAKIGDIIRANSVDDISKNLISIDPSHNKIVFDERWNAVRGRSGFAYEPTDIPPERLQTLGNPGLSSGALSAAVDILHGIGMIALAISAVIAINESGEAIQRGDYGAAAAVWTDFAATNAAAWGGGVLTVAAAAALGLSGPVAVVAAIAVAAASGYTTHELINSMKSELGQTINAMIKDYGDIAGIIFGDDAPYREIRPDQRNFLWLPSQALIQGTTESDYITGTDSDDLIIGNDGDDIIIGGEGTDIIRPGLGIDYVSGSEIGKMDDSVANTVSYDASFHPETNIPLGTDPGGVEIEFAPSDESSPLSNVPRLYVYKEGHEAGAHDTLDNIQRVIGTQYADRLTFGTTLTGNAGFDAIGLGFQKFDLRASDFIGQNQDVVDFSALDSGVFFDARTSIDPDTKRVTPSSGRVRALAAVQSGGAAGLSGWIARELSILKVRQGNAAVNIYNSNEVIGTRFDDVLYGSSYQGKAEDVADGPDGLANDDAYEGFSVLKGGDGSDALFAAGYRTEMYGGAGADMFSVGNGTIIEDGDTTDRVFVGGLPLFGGIKPIWMKANYAIPQMFSGVANAFPVIGADIFSAAALFLDAPYLGLAHFAAGADGSLAIRYGMGDHWAQTIVRDYKLDLDTGKGSAGLTVFAAERGDHVSRAQFGKFVNLALMAGFGVKLPGYDPIVLDLNGNGVELWTVENSPVYRDVGITGFAERTGWARGGDGMLVRDLDGNGSIDTQAEMFAADGDAGYAGLAAYDTNSDGVIDSSDAGYGSLRVWIDANEDGRTDAGELKTLLEAGVAALSLSTTTVQDDAIAGSAVTGRSTFTRSDGSTGGTAEVTFTVDPTQSIYSGDQTVSAEAAALPQFLGIGRAADLRVVASHDAVLLGMLENFVATTNLGLASLTDQATDILLRWTRSDGVAATPIGDFDAQRLAALETLAGTELAPRVGGVVSDANVDELNDLWNDTVKRFTLRLAIQGPLADMFGSIDYLPDRDTLLVDSTDDLAEAFDSVFAILPAMAPDALAAWAEWAPLLAALVEDMSWRDDSGPITIDDGFALAALQRALADSASPLTIDQLAPTLGYAHVKTGTSGDDVLQRDGDGHFTFVSSGGSDTFIGGGGEDFYLIGANAGTVTVNDVEANPQGDTLQFSALNRADITAARDGADLVLTSLVDNTVVRVVGQFADVARGGGGTILSLNRGVESILFADGTLLETGLGQISALVGTGGIGNDTIHGTNQGDYLEGGKGDDVLSGGDDGDFYYYNAGDGNDVISDVMGNPLVKAADMLMLGKNIAPSDVAFSRAADGDNLIITVGSGESSSTITVAGQFAYNVLGTDQAFATTNAIELFMFEGFGETYSNIDVQQLLLAQQTTDGNDTTYGFGTNDFFAASAGDDTLVGLDGADQYYWGAGAGNDTIDERARFIDVNVGLGGISLTVEADMVRFSEGTDPSTLVFSRNYDTDDLVITNSATGETLTVDGQFNSFQTGVLGPQWFDRVEWFAFADNSAYSWQDVEAMVTTGAAGNDRLRGDILADRMVGGRGDDLLSGGGGGDTYVFNAGDGHDTVFDDNWTLIGDGFLTADQTIDKVQLGEGFDPDDVAFTRNGSAITLTFGSSGDAITLQGQDDYVQTGVFGAIPTNRIEQVVFHDGTVWTWQDINQKMIAAQTTAGDDVTEGFTLSDRFEKSAGDDILRGGESGDTYVFGVGAGHDRIEESVSNVLYGDDDSVEFDNTVAVADVSVARDGTDLILSLTSGDSLRVAGEFELQTLYTWRDVENFRFADGTVWSKADIQRKLLQSTSGDDHLVGFYSSDDLDGGAGNDILEGGDGSDTYHFDRGYGNDEIRESVTEVNVGDYDQVVFGPTLLPEDLTVTRDGNDLVLTVADTGETLRITGQYNFGSWFAWNDVELFKFANGTQWTDIDVAARLTGGTSGDDHLIGTFRSDTLDGKEGNDLLEGGDGSDIYLFGRGYGHDEIRESLTDANLGEDDEVRFGANISLADLGFTRDGDNLVISIAGTDDTLTLTGEFTYSFPYTWNDVERFTFADGSFITKGQVSQMVLAGTPGNDHIIGFGSDDTLDGGAGDDILEGMDGSDTYRFGVGDGHDTVYEILTDGRSTEFDTLAFKDGVLPGDVTVTREGQDAIFTLASGDSIRVVGEFNPGYNELLRSNDVERVTFSDGTVWSKAVVQQKLLQSTSGDDHLVGFYTGDDLDGGGGNDLLEGGDGSDTYHFDRGYGNDEIREGVTDVNAGDFDQVVFGPTLLPEDLNVARDGNDLVLTVADTGETLRVTGQYNFGSWFAWNDVELFKFANGTQWTDLDIAARLTGGTSGDDHLIGTFRSDTLDGKEGNDLLEGGDGSDIYLFGRGYGHDEIRESLTDANLGEDDEVRFGANITLADLGFTRDGDNLVISIAGTDDTLTLTGEFTYSFPYTWNDVERFTFADGSFITKADVSQMVLAGTPGNDHIIGFGSNDTLDGGAGDDILEGTDGSDTYRFGVGDGHDTVHEILTDGRTTEFDTLVFKDGVLPTDVTVTREGQDAIFTLSSGDTIRVVGQFNYGYNEFLSFNDIEQATFADGTVWSKADILLKVLQGTPGDDILIGGSGSDILDGGAGNDRLEGSEGSDTYVWGTGYGNDTIHETFDLILRPEEDRLNIKGVDPDDLVIARSGNDIILTIPSGETLTIEGQLFDGRHDIDEFAFDDGTVWDLGTINAQILLQQATPGNDSINGFAGDDYLFGAAGNDDLNGSEGNDVLDGGTGDDLLRGDIGNDTYRFGIGGGHDTIDDHRNGWAMGDDTIEFGTGIAKSDVAVTRDVDDLLLTITATGDSVRIVSGAVATGAVSREIEHVHFADGSNWTSAELRAFAIGATAGADSIVGSDAAEQLDGLDGNDLIEARGGNDIVIGGVGNDTLAGEDGDDTYRYALGDGDDVINDNIHGWGGYHGFDTVDFAAGIDPADVRISVQNGDFLVSFGGAPGSLRLVGSASQANSAIERITFADDTIWTYAEMVARSLVASAGADSLYGGNYDDVINGLAGDDFINGRGGNDDITGGAGDDVMAGQGGDDTYRYALGDGDDIIDDNIDGNNGNQGFDTLVLGAGITVANTEVTVSTNGRDFKLSFDGGSGSVALAGTAVQSSGSVDRIVFADGTIWTYADLQSRVVTNPAIVVGTNRNDNLYGGDGAQTLIGKQGNDNLEGRNGGDEYRYASGDGNDWINDNGASSDTDALKLTDLLPGDVTLSRDGVHLYVNVTATGQRIGVNNQFWDGHPEYGIEQIVFADGTTWDRNRISRDAPIVGGNGDDGLYGTSLDDTLIGHAGNDYLEGRGGSDTYRYASGDGFDTIRDNGALSDVDVLALNDLNPGQVELRREGDDLYLRDIGAGRDIHVLGQFQADGTAGLEQVSFADGTIWDRDAIRQHAWVQGWYLNQPGNESLYGSSLDDTLAGHGGDDYLEGRDGSDTYRYASGDGNDRIYENGSTANTDTLQLTDLGPAGVVLRRDGSDLYVADVATGQEIRVQNQFYSDQQYAIEQIKFADGTVWDRETIRQHAWIQGWYLNQPGNENLYGSGLDDTLAGHGGDDYLEGRDGSDTYRYASGDGNDRIYENGSTANTDTLQLTDLGPASVVLRRDGSDLYVADVATGQQIRVQNQFYSDQQYAIEQIKFADGTVWDRARIAAETSAVRGTNGADFLNGSANADIIYGIGGDDMIHGAAGDDRVDGGDGADTLSGNDGDDTMVGGAGNDVINGDESALVAVGSNLVVNGSFEDFGGTETYYSWGANIATMPGWVKATSAQYEAGRTYATEGSWYIDLEAYYQNMDISQTIAGLTQGSVYSLQFDSRNTGSAANGFELYWNGQLMGAVPNAPSTITTYSILLVADGGANTLRFVSTGPVDNDGASLDNVQLRATVAAIAGNGADMLTGGAGNDVLYGGGGSDVAIYSGSSADYSVTSNEDGSYTVEDLIADRDGIDTLTSIETLRFADGDFDPLNLSGGGQLSMRSMVYSESLQPALASDQRSRAQHHVAGPWGSFDWVDDWSFDDGAAGRFGGLGDGVGRRLDRPLRPVAIDALGSHARPPALVGASASLLAQGMAAFAAAPAGEMAGDRRRNIDESDLWIARHRDGVGPVHPFEIAA